MEEPRIEKAKPITPKQVVVIITVLVLGLAAGSLIVLKHWRTPLNRRTALGYDGPVAVPASSVTNAERASPAAR